MKKTPYCIVIIMFCFLFTAFSQEQNPVYHIKVDGTINPSSFDYIQKAIQEAKKKNAACLVIELNTPGGLLKSTRYIVSDILTSEVPVIVFVSPSGAQAGSAGVFITLAGHIAAMAPGTNIGASHPVSTDGKMDSVMSEKTTNDAAAFIRSISEKRKRNVQWSEDAVRKSVSITETEALQMNVIDLIANDLNDLLQKADGREVETPSGKKILKTKGAVIVEYEEGWFAKILELISDPNIAYILMMLGIWGILLEFYNPGSILPGVVGGICIILGLYGLHTLPINYAGLALIILAIILFIAEIKVTSYGMLTVGGVISLLLGSMMLIDIDNPLEATVKISMSVIITTVVILTFLFLLLGWFVVRAYKKKVTTGAEGLIGDTGVVFRDITLAGEGLVKLHGEIWKAVSEAEIPKGSKVKVLEIQDLKIKVAKI